MARYQQYLAFAQQLLSDNYKDYNLLIPTILL